MPGLESDFLPNEMETAHLTHRCKAIRATWVYVFLLPCASSVTLGESLNLSEPWSPHL